MTPLRQRMLEDLQVRNLSPHTQPAYIENVARFARHFGRSPADLGPEELRTYQVYLIRERTLAPSSVEIAVCALRFLYKVTLRKPWSFDDLIPAPKKPRRLSVVLSRARWPRGAVWPVPPHAHLVQLLSQPALWPRRPRRRPRALPLQGLPRPHVTDPEDDDARCHEIHPALSPARAATRISPHSLLLLRPLGPSSPPRAPRPAAARTS